MNQFKFSVSFYIRVACGILSCFTIASCENSLEDINKVTSRTPGIEVGKGITIIYTVGAQTKSEITAPLMLHHQDASKPYYEFTNTIHADFFDDSLHIQSTMDAHYAKYMETESKIFLKDSVVVMNNKGDTLYCDELYWDRDRKGQEFHTDKPVRIRTPSQILDGDGMDAPQDFSNWHLINGRGILRVHSSEFP